MTPYNSGYSNPVELERLPVEEFAKKLRDNPTKAEAAILTALRERGFWFQQVCGDYVVDFFHAELLVVLEVDGWSHHGNERRDQRRENDLLTGCYLVIRVPNSMAQSKNNRTNCLMVLDRMLEIIRWARGGGIYLTGVWKLETERKARTDCRRNNEGIYLRALKASSG
jgi:very-short-patch-repair endonuclease